MIISPKYEEQPSLYMSLIKKCSKSVNQNSKPVFRLLHVVTPVPENNLSGQFPMENICPTIF